MHTDVVAGEIAARQLGLITRAQASKAGISAGEIQRRTRTRRWKPLRPGVYALTGTPDTWEQRVLAVVLSAGPGAVASHLTAAALHQFPDVPRDSIEVTVPPGCQPRARGFRVHRPQLLPDHDATRFGLIPVTSYARTLVDCTGRLSLGQLARALDAGLVGHAVTLWSVERTVRELKQAPGRHPSKLWTLLGERGSETALAESRPEIRLGRLLASAGLPEPVQQHWVRVRTERFRLDFAYPEQKVAIEYDGWDAHRSRGAFDRDRRRDRLLQLAGWTVLRFTSRSSSAEILDAVRLCMSRS
jgi:hypothetical protein